MHLKDTFVVVFTLLGAAALGVALPSVGETLVPEIRCEYFLPFPMKFGVTELLILTDADDDTTL
ncbi:hypothetical protein EST38_g9795 [Candolleomyces aberdarensis]|uniref:Uncharacterized protein n=1 Tax=Candolleomyces aberdarensis TaxID=2316362 RepID=A0A4Q2D915_9AGAR|nr:hypothetical protein EST38_g9795 [Candolleomyces aberdarensis]